MIKLSAAMFWLNESNLPDVSDHRQSNAKVDCLLSLARRALAKNLAKALFGGASVSETA